MRDMAKYDSNVDRIKYLKAERDALAAVIAEAKYWAGARAHGRVRAILASTDPSEVLRSRDEKTWAEGFRAGHYSPAEIESGNDFCECGENPYRVEGGENQ